MGNISTVILLLAVVTALAQVTDRIKVPYPVMLVLAGIGIGLVPGLPIVSLDADVVFLLFLPPFYMQPHGTLPLPILKNPHDPFRCWLLAACFLPPP